MATQASFKRGVSPLTIREELIKNWIRIETGLYTSYLPPLGLWDFFFTKLITGKNFDVRR